jgi:hypothetical protein
MLHLMSNIDFFMFYILYIPNIDVVHIIILRYMHTAGVHMLFIQNAKDKTGSLLFLSANST